MASIPPNASLKELLEPAIEGPPSPESIRAFSNRVRRAASNADATQPPPPPPPPKSHHTTSSSASSSLRSHRSTDQTSVDTATLDGSGTLSRKSSSRSTASTAPHDRHESVLFGWTRFGKKGRLRRETSPLGSSNSSIYSTDAVDSPASITAHGPSAASFSTKGARVSFFGRRRTTRSGLSDEGESRRRIPPISEPFGFQHLSHIQDDHVNGSAKPQTTTKPKESLHFPNFSSEVLPLPADSPSATAPSPSSLAPTARQYVGRPHAASVSSVYPQRQPLLHTRSQDQLRMAPPPRPPRSPIDASAWTPPIPPPRTSSSRMAPLSDFSSFGSLGTERPRTSGGFFRAPQPLSASSLRPARLGHSHSYSEDVTSRSSDVDTRRFSRLLPDLELPVTSAPSPVASPPIVPEGANWPLSSSQSAASTAAFAMIPEVPEEDEQRGNNRNSVQKSRMSTTSNSSSLRKSHSLPLMQLMQTQTPVPAPAVSSPTAAAAPTQRPPSSASDTLGGPDVVTVQRARRQSAVKDQSGADDEDDVDPARGSWEDDIDYCYEHEIEADCEYAWERPSIDSSGEDVRAGLAGLGLDANESIGRMAGRSLRSLTNFSIKNVVSSKSSSPAVGSASPTSMLSPSSFGMPALSPASQASTSTIDEAVTPTITSTSGFAARRPPDLVIKTSPSLLYDEDMDNDGDMLHPMQQQQHKSFHGRSGSRSSRASSYKESHGFNLSPSFFIPGTEKYNWYDQQQDYQAHGVPVGCALSGGHYEDSLISSSPGRKAKSELPAYLASTAAVLGMDQTPMLVSSRTSGSTTASHYSRDSALSDRHISATSTSTDLTHLTMSTASIEDLMYNNKTEHEVTVPQIPLLPA